MPATGYNREKYFVTFIDAANKHLFIELLLDKTAESVLASFKKVHKILKNTFSNPVKRLHADNGGEYDYDLMKEYLAEQGTELTTTAPYNPRSYGVAERANRTVMNKVRAILLRSNVGFEYWPDAVRQVTCLRNRTPATNSGGVTPYKKVFGRIPSHIRIFGCLVYAKVPDEKRKKLFEKPVKYALLQFLPVIQYKVLDLDNGDIYCVRDAKIDETKFPFLALVMANSLVMATRSLVERDQGPKHLQNTILMMTTLQATTQTMITMGLMMTSIRKRSSPIGHQHYLKLLQTLRRQREHLLMKMTMMKMRRCFLRQQMKMTIPVGKPLNKYRHGHNAFENLWIAINPCI
jgi:hypothetical protein